MQDENTTTDRLEALRVQFIERCRNDIAALEPMTRRDASIQAARTELAGIAHRLAGSGGTFGYPEVSAAAAQLEARLDPESPPDHPGLSAALAQLLGELRRIAGPGSLA